jgi:hypothetical protein
MYRALERERRRGGAPEPRGARKIGEQAA